MARLQRVFIDTSELFPFTLIDVLPTLAEDFLFTWVWTDEILDEWTEVIVREGKRTPESAASVAAAVRSHFGDTASTLPSTATNDALRSHIGRDLDSDLVYPRRLRVRASKAACQRQAGVLERDYGLAMN